MESSVFHEQTEITENESDWHRISKLPEGTYIMQMSGYYNLQWTIIIIIIIIRTTCEEEKDIDRLRT